MPTRSRGDAARAYTRAGRLRPALFHLDRAHDAAADVTFLRARAALGFEARLQAVEGDLARSEPVAAERIDDLPARAPAHGAAALAKAIVRAGWADAIGGRFAHALGRLDALADGGDQTVLADVAPLAAYAHVARVTGKLGVNSRARAVARAVARGILSAGREYDYL